MNDYTLEVIVPVTRTVYVRAIDAKEARALAKQGDWYDASPFEHDLTEERGATVLSVTPR